MRGEKDMSNKFTIIESLGTMPHNISLEWGHANFFFVLVYRSAFSSVILLPLLFSLAIIGNKVNNKVYNIIAIILALGATAIPLYYNTVTGSMAMLHLAVVFVMTATVFILNFVKLSALDYAILFSSFYYIFRYVGWSSFHTIFLGMNLIALYVFIVVLVVYKIRLKQLTGNLFYLWFTCILVFIKGFAVSRLFSRHIVGIGQAAESRITALIVWGIALTILIGAVVAIIYAIKRGFKRHFDEINQMGKAYPQLEKFFIYNTLGIIIIMGALYYMYGVSSSFFGNPTLRVFDIFLLFAMVLQVSFLVMVFRITWLKDHNQNLAAYSSGLEKNIDHIKNIKHDVKNIFLTMGNFVEQSGNAEMQEFYNKKISPFAKDEIAKNDLYSQLATLPNEQLKAFLFYKISQAVKRGITVDLDVYQFDGNPPIDFIDLVRILGILLDNAIEECMEINNGIIQLKLSRNNEMISYVIKNTVRPQIKEKGVRAGTSTKGNDRGTGLLSIKSIVEKYDFVMLNSYFAQDCFVQNLVIHHR